MTTDEVLSDLLRQWGTGREVAKASAFSSFYDYLLATAKNIIAQSPEDLGDLSPEALVSDLFVHLAGKKEQHWRDPLHLATVTAKLMRQMLLASRRQSHRDYSRRLAIEEALAAGSGDESSRAQMDILALHEALEKLRSIDAQGANIVDLRFFGGFTDDEVASLLGVSPLTVSRKWRLVRAWLYQELFQRNADVLECVLYIGSDGDADAESVLSALSKFLNTLGFSLSSGGAPEVG